MNTLAITQLTQDFFFLVVFLFCLEIQKKKKKGCFGGISFDGKKNPAFLSLVYKCLAACQLSGGLCPLQIGVPHLSANCQGQPGNSTGNGRAALC